MVAPRSVPDPVRDMPLERIQATLARITEWKRAGIGGSRLRARIEARGLDPPSVDLLLDIHATRSSSVGKYPEGGRLFFTGEGLRWATPRTAADHCARRMSSTESADVTCGQGGQAMSLSRTCDRVLAIEKDSLNVFLAALNFRALGLDNIEIVQGDCLDPELVRKVGKGSPVFSDPSRPGGAAERTLEELQPDPRDIMGAYEGRACGFCFEVPPYLSPSRIDFTCEREYVSIEGRLNRLNLYTGGLMSARVSAVVLPSGYSVAGPAGAPVPSFEGWTHWEFAAEADPAVMAAGLIGDSLGGMRAHILELDGRRTLAITEHEEIHGALGPPMRILSICSEKDLAEELRRVGAGKVTLRFSIDPAHYWERRKAIEATLTGKRKVQLFKGDMYIVAEAVNR